MNQNNLFDLASDDPFVNVALEVGRFIGPDFVSLGSATTDYLGVFDFRFVRMTRRFVFAALMFAPLKMAGAGGNFSLVDSATQKEIVEFTCRLIAVLRV